ncbi:hypothetical protein OSB04_031921 [Centaurea solstitialis]|uniref:Cytochrome P450 n=1 Tax=Centaurea solstitialis TaxID=347529 RepID=A0AA38SBC2_9ASTR|nr:hypothetical protein OSB04_031921 [Centaurea solstitialis]
MTTHFDTTLFLFALTTSSNSINNIFIFFTLIFIIKCLVYTYSHRLRSTIPGPIPLPIIGNMHLMSGLAHRKIAQAARSCGATRLMAFTLGETRVIVTCNPDVAKDILNSSVFADRPVKESAYGLMFNRAIGFAPYGVYWRTLRRIAATHLFCPKQIRVSENQRMLLSNQMVDMVFLVLHHQHQGKNKTTSCVCVRCWHNPELIVLF